MMRLLLFDLCCSLAPGPRGLQARVLRELASIPRDLRSDMGLSDARLADVARNHLRAAMAAQRAEEARRLLDLLNRIARKRGFPALCWRSEEGA